jgi:histidine triad (HIT) family protein
MLRIPLTGPAAGRPEPFAANLPGLPVGAEHGYAAVIATRRHILHLHLLPRYPGTPREYWWDRVDGWPDARSGIEPEITGPVAGLRGYLTAAARP